ncbi:MAG: hypothetical protein MUO38_15435 [Anaerolineales bacterium]|nr:hypothetical protein [Anaerolineales bacterium]
MKRVTHPKPDPATLPPIQLLPRLRAEAESVAKRAKKAKQSLAGTTTYAESFHQARVSATTAFKELETALSPTASPGLSRTLSDIAAELSYFFSPKTPLPDRKDLRRHIELLLKSELAPALKSLHAAEQEYVPLEIVQGRRVYVTNVASQANRAFSCGCYDASAVMIRRLLETLIIEVFEAKAISHLIADKSGNYLMFGDLVNKLINTKETPVGKTTRRELPTIANVLSNCAHTRAFNISKPQLLQYQAHILIAVQELINLWAV